MGVESKIRELMEGAANRPKDKQQGDASNPTQGSSNANPEMQDLSGTGNAEGGLTSPVGKAAEGKASKDGTLPKGAGAKEAPANFTNDKPSETDVMKKASAGNVAREEVEADAEEVIAEDEVVTDEVIAEDEVVAEDAEEIAEEEVSVEEAALFEADLNALFADEDHLTEEFKVKAAEMFEAVVTSRVSAEIAQIEEELTEAANVEFESQLEQMVENVDKYLSYVTENWMAENQIAIESGIRTEVTESFIKGLQQVFSEHYIEVPEEKYDVMTEMQNQIDTLTARLDEEIETSMAIKEEAISLKKQAVFARISEGLASTEAEKFATLVEDITYTGMDSYEQKLQVVKENYFPAEKSLTEDVLEDTFEAADEVTNTVMSKYAQAISKSTKF
jgi:hypothetical protein